MLREIHQQPAVLRATLAAYAGADAAETTAPVRRWLRSAWAAPAPRLVIAASGSSRHAGLYAESLIEDLAGLPVDVEYASEYALRPAHTFEDAAVLVVSQSGETADTLAALRRANELHRATLAITNVAGSAMAREAGAVFPVLAGRELAIPATKSFTAQLLNLLLLARLAAEPPHAAEPALLARIDAGLPTLPASIAARLSAWDHLATELAARHARTASFLFAGRGVHMAIAREGALKLKESAYVHAEGYPAGELRHGPNALLGTDATPLVMVCTFDPQDPHSTLRHARDLELLRGMRAQGTEVIAVANADDAEVDHLASAVLPVDPAPDALLAIAEVVPLQLFAYRMAVGRGIDVDHPRNLSKAVLAE